MNAIVDIGRATDWLRTLYSEGDVSGNVYYGTNHSPLHCYLETMLQLLYELKFTENTLVIVLIYVRRLVRGGLRIGDANVRRVLFSCFCLAMKYHDDKSYSNQTISRLSGMKCRDISRLELETLTRLNYELHVSVEEWQEELVLLHKLDVGGPEGGETDQNVGDRRNMLVRVVSDHSDQVVAALRDTEETPVEAADDHQNHSDESHV